MAQKAVGSSPTGHPFTGLPGILADGRAFSIRNRQVQRVLVLNATYEPLSVISVQRAVVLLLKEKAELVEATAERLRGG